MADFFWRIDFNTKNSSKQPPIVEQQKHKQMPPPQENRIKKQKLEKTVPISGKTRNSSKRLSPNIKWRGRLPKIVVINVRGLFWLFAYIFDVQIDSPDKKCISLLSKPYSGKWVSVGEPA